MAANEYRPDIQIIRGISVLAVILYHSQSNFFKFGYLGVDVFFVVSGFVILPSLAKNLERYDQPKFNLLEFYKRRFLRLYPGLVVSIMVSTIILWLLFSPEYHSRIASQGIASLFFIGNIGALIYSGDYFAPNPNPLIHLWSLAVEAQIYFVLPVLLIIFQKLRIKILTSIYCLTALSLIFFSFPFLSESILSWFGYPNKGQASFYLSFDRFWQFSIGGLFGIFNPKHFKNFLASKWTYQGMLLAIFIAIYFAGDNQKISSVFATFLAVLLITGQKLKHNCFKWLLWIGDRSYSLYLFHLPIFAVLNYSPTTSHLQLLHPVLKLFMGILLVFLLSDLNFHFIEQKYRMTSRLNNSKQTVKFPFLGYFYICLAALITLNASSLAKLEKFARDNNIKVEAWNLDKNCERMTNSGPPCIYDNGAKDTILLIGDSHAAQYSQTLVDLGLEKKFNIVIWTQAGCVFTIYSMQNDNIPIDCIHNNKKKMNWILDNQPQSVIVSYLMTKDYDEKVLLNSLTFIKQHVEHVILIQNNPIFPDRDKFLQLLPIVMKQYSNPKSFRVNDMDLTNVFVANSFYAKAKKYGISTIDISPQICGANFCKRWLNNEWLYGDENHLSVAGANLIKPILWKEFKS